MPVILSPNIKKTSIRLDFEGNEIDPRTKQVIKPKEVESILPPEAQAPSESVIAPTAGVTPNSGGLSILQQIEEAKKNLQALEELKKLKIAEKKAELELLQQ
jgi:hypothetical protein